MKPKHTPVPWRIILRRSVGGRTSEIHLGTDHGESGSYTTAIIPVFGEASEDNARRILACVNALEGIADPSVVPELLDVLRKVNQRVTETTRDYRIDHVLGARIDAILDRAEGRDK